MANENTELKKDLEEMQKDIEELKEAASGEVAVAEPMIGDTAMHIFNISIAMVMIIIGGILAYQLRNAGQKQKSGKKIASLILLILGALTLITHVSQLIF